jgi:F-type H+-transporting ATPase subunit c
MIDVIALLHYSMIALTVCINSISIAIGQGLTSIANLNAINRQPQARNDITRTAILGTALIETGAVLAVAMAILLLRDGVHQPLTAYRIIAEFGIASALCFSGFAVGLVSCKPVQQACIAIARQPFFSQNILRIMLITQMLTQTPIIFGFIVSLFIRNQAMSITTYTDALRLAASGLAIGLGSVGPIIGLAQFAQAVCEGVGINRHAYNRLLSFTFISQAIIETTAIFALLVALVFLFSTTATDTLASGIAFLAAGLCIGFGTFGPGISSGRTSAAACAQIARNPEQYATLSKLSMVAQGLIDTGAIYALLLSLVIYFLT